jgi:polar amino acid transport system substrate-binding protein
MRIRSLLWMVVISTCLAQSANARDVDGILNSGRLIACANKNAMPVSGWGDVPGFQVEIAQEIAAELGVQLSIDWIWASYQARKTDCDMILGVARDPKPGGFARYLQALIDVDIVLVFQGEPREITLDQLTGKVIAVPSASLSHFKLLDIKADPRVAYKSEVQILDDVQNGVLDGGVVSSVALDWYRHGNPEVQMFHVSTDILGVVSSYPMTIGLRHADALDEADLQEIVTRMRDDGRLERILGRYGQTLSKAFDDPYASVPDEVSEPSSIAVRKDIIEDVKRRVEDFNHDN